MITHSWQKWFASSVLSFLVVSVFSSSVLPSVFAVGVTGQTNLNDTAPTIEEMFLSETTPNGVTVTVGGVEGIGAFAVSDTLTMFSTGANKLGDTVLPNVSTVDEKRLYAYGVVRDVNGQAEITGMSSFEAVLARTDLAEACAEGVQVRNTFNCFYSSSSQNEPGHCQLSNGGTDDSLDTDSTRVHFLCTFLIPSYLEATDLNSADSAADWTMMVSARSMGADLGTLSTDSSETFEVGTVQSLGLPETMGVPTPIDWGNRTLGSQAGDVGASNVTYVLTQQGNDKMDVEVSGPVTGLVCSVRGAIPVTNIARSTSPIDNTGTALAQAPDVVDVNVARVTQAAADAAYGEGGDRNVLAPSSKMFWLLDVPSSGIAGSCTGEITITAVHSN